MWACVRIAHSTFLCVLCRNLTDRKFALRALERHGAQLTTSECALLHLMRDSAHPKFREVQKLIVQASPDCGYVQAGRPSTH